MSAIYSNNYMSNYSATSVAKSSSANDSTQMSETAKTQSAAISSSNSYGDTVTISQEGLEAYKQLSAKDVEEPRILDLPPKEKKYWYDKLHRNVEKKDNDEADPSIVMEMYYAMSNNEIAKLNSIKWRESITKIDERIAEILDENGIVLNEKETLNFSIDQSGKIKIGNGINGDKKAILEKIFNEDNNFRADLINSHNLLKKSQPVVWGYRGLENNESYSGYNPSKSAKYDYILRNYGFTSYDFELTTDEERNAGALAIKFKDGSKNDELLMKIFTEDAEAFDAIERNLEHINQSGENAPAKFEYSFSYKNGVTIEKGQGDENSLNKRYDYVMDDPMYHVSPHPDKTTAAITISPSGEIVDSQIIDQKFFNGYITNKDEVVTEQELDSFLQRMTNNYLKRNNTQNYQTWFQQYVFETQRLTRFETGVSQEEVENMNLTISRTFDSYKIQERTK